MDPLSRLAVAARDGDRVALAAFVERSQADVWRFCAHQLGREHADDATQETYLRAIGALRSFRGRPAPARGCCLSPGGSVPTSSAGRCGAATSSAG
jgi:RNA polymerase sigma-70 factor (ECF subfamily)